MDLNLYEGGPVFPANDLLGRYMAAAAAAIARKIEADLLDLYAGFTLNGATVVRERRTGAAEQRAMSPDCSK